MDPVTSPKPPDRDNVSIDPGAIGAFKVSQDDFATLGLNLDMKTAYPFIVQTKGIALLTAYRDGQFHSGILDPPIDSFKNLKGGRHQIGFGLAHTVDYKGLLSP